MSLNMNRRKLACGSLCFMTGIAGAFYKNCSVILILCIWTVIYLRTEGTDRKRKLFLVAMVLAFSAGVILYAVTDIQLYGNCREFPTGTAYTCTGVITDVREKKNNMTELLCKVEGERILCTYKGEIKNPYNIIGRKIIFTLYLHRSEDNIFARSRKVPYYSYLSGFLLDDFVFSPLLSLKRLLLLKKDHFLEPFPENYGPGGRLIPGILFGSTGSLEEEVREAFSQNGTAHLLAVSGLHIGILYSAFIFVSGKLKHSFLLVVFLFLLILYGTCCFWSVSVQRAVIMVLLLMGGDRFCRPYDMLTAACFSSVVILCLNPYALFTVSFHMSFLAVIFIAFLGPLLREYMGNYLAMALSVQAGLGPYMVYVFETFSFKGILCNIPSVFLGTAIVPVGVLLFFLYLFTGIRLKTGDLVIAGLSGLLVKLNQLFSSVDFLMADFAISSLSVILLYYTLVLYLSSEYFTVHRLRKEYFTLFYTGFIFFLMMYVLCAGGLYYAGQK